MEHQQEHQVVMYLFGYGRVDRRSERHLLQCHTIPLNLLHRFLDGFTCSIYSLINVLYSMGGGVQFVQCSTARTPIKHATPLKHHFVDLYLLPSHLSTRLIAITN